jgi:tight adherence protein B
MTPRTLLAALLVGLGLAMVTAALERRSARRLKNLRQELELAYLDETAREPKDVASLLSRSGAFTERALQGTGFLDRLGGVIQRSDYELAPGELVLVSLVAAVVSVFVALAVGSPILGVVLAVVALIAPYSLVARSVSKRMRRFEAQFPDILDLVAASLESGASVSQAFELVVAEAEEPAASEFARVLAASRMGEPLIDSLEALGERLGSRDVQWTVRAIGVQQRTGGRLAEVLRIVAGVMRSREEIRREIRALTAEGRLSAYVLTGLPIVFTGFLALVRPAYLEPLYNTTLGIAMLAAGGLALVAGYLVMMRIVKIEV